MRRVQESVVADAGRGRARELSIARDLRRAIGRLLCIGLPGPSIEVSTREQLVALCAGTVVLFRRNFESVDQLRALTAELHALPSRPLVAVDHEGGRVQRLNDPFTRFPPAAALGRRGDPELAYSVGLAMGRELAAAGIDLNFAPVLDVHSNPANPVIGDRALSSDPQVVASLGVALMRGLRDAGVIPCGKHFPGHGDTAVDSHRELPWVQRSRAELERTELVPFRAAVAAEIPMIMTAHVVFPALDPDRPATVSRAILSELLRGELGFGGVIASDDLEMRAIAGQQDIGAAAVASLRAGADMLLVCEHLARGGEVFAAVERAVLDGTLPSDVVVAAATRIEALREVCPGPAGDDCPLPNPAHRALVEHLELDPVTA